MKKIILSALMLTGALTFAQEGKLTISGSVDAYYKSNLNGSTEQDLLDDNGQSVFLSPATSFADAQGFALGMANTVLAYETGNTGMVADLVFGPKGTQASNTVLNQLYAYWNVNDKATFTLGKFNTYLGYEVISPTGNFFYSTSYMFSNGPFSHTGLKFDYAVSDDLSFALALMNETDVTEVNPTANYVLGGQLGYKGQYLNFRAGTDGAEGLFQIDYTGGFDLTDTFYLGINATHKLTEDETNFTGAALYAQLSLSDSFSVGLRPELFYSSEAGVDNDDIFALTAAANYKVGNLTIIPEVRVDSYENDIQLSTDPTDLGTGLTSVLVAAVYAF